MKPHIRRFVDLIEQAGRGRLSEHLDENLATAVEALEALPDGAGGAATITLTVTLKAQGDLVNVVPTVKTKLPEGKAIATTPFWLDDGALSVQHPNQTDMFTGPKPVRRDDTAAG